MDNDTTGFLYLKTPSGILRIIEIIFAVCTFISVLVYKSTWEHNPIAFFGITSILALLYSLFILVCSVMNWDSFQTELWRKINLYLCIVIAILSFSAGALFIPRIKNSETIISAVVCAYMMGFTYFGNITIKVFRRT